MVENLVERIRQKDQRAMSQLYQMYIRELSSVCYRFVPSQSDAKDVLQEFREDLCIDSDLRLSRREGVQDLDEESGGERSPPVPQGTQETEGVAGHEDRGF